MKKIISKFLALALILPVNFSFAENLVLIGTAPNQDTISYLPSSIQHVGQSVYMITIAVHITSNAGALIQGQTAGSASSLRLVIDCSSNIYAVGRYEHYILQSNQLVLASQQMATDLNQLQFNPIRPNSPESMIANNTVCRKS